MGAKLVRIFEIVMEKGGLSARMEFAERTGFSMKKAAEIPDTEELIDKFKNIAAEIIEHI